ncbi:MAG: TGS domain-containing protein [Candidatus Diapherotrites archaeon]|nr:TGS domain-containing protein [Candidatus Diapherotrites archaeon]
MTTNVSVEYGKAQEKYEAAKTDAERLQALLEMKSAAPNHKGAENMRVELGKKISKLKMEIEKQKTQESKKGSGQSLAVKKDGIGQIVLIGLPNAGKSCVLKALTGVDVQIAPFEFTTTIPEKGMVFFEQVQIQIVELPAIIEGSSEGKANGTQIISIVRNADAVCLVLNGNNALQEYKILASELRKSNILLNDRKPRIRVESSKFPGISMSGKQFLKCRQEEFEGFLKTMGFSNASVMLEEPTDLALLAKALDEKLVYKNAIAFFIRQNPEQLEELKKEFGGKIMVFQDYKSKEKIEEAKKELFQILGKIRIFTKKPGKEADKEPLVLPIGCTIEDVAKDLHKDFAASLKYAKLWGSSKFEGQRVPKDYQLQDKDIVEISA